MNDRHLQIRDEKGASLIEFSFVFVLLLMIALGAFEYGMLFRDSLTVATAAREAGRVGASTASFGQADCVILEAASGSLQALDTGVIDFVHIYKSDRTGAYAVGGNAFRNLYWPTAGNEIPDLVCNGSTWKRTLGGSWAPNQRINAEGAADWIGVRIEYTHQWQTGFLWMDGGFALADDGTFRLEPPRPTP